MTTGIEWTDETWNPVVGCTKVSQGCKHCYAKTIHDMRHKAHREGKKVAPQYAHPFETVQLMPDRLDAPLRRRRPTKYFVNSVSDLFHEDVPDEYLDRVFGIMAQASRHVFQILTKRPERMQEYSAGMAALSPKERTRRIVRSMYAGHPAQAIATAVVPDDHVGDLAWPLPNVWLGTSVEDQKAADERIPLLLQTSAAVRFLSCEPLIGAVDLTRWFDGNPACPKYSVDCLSEDGDCHDACEDLGLHWVIVGGESGHGARACNVQWIRELVAACGFAGVPCFVKQLGSRPVFGEGPAPHIQQRDRKGGNIDEWPTDLRVRQFPGELAA